MSLTQSLLDLGTDPVDLLYHLFPIRLRGLTGDTIVVGNLAGQGLLRW